MTRNEINNLKVKDIIYYKSSILTLEKTAPFKFTIISIYNDYLVAERDDGVIRNFNYFLHDFYSTEKECMVDYIKRYRKINDINLKRAQDSIRDFEEAYSDFIKENIEEFI